MCDALKYWRDKTREEKKHIMSESGIKAITYEQIILIYKNKK